MEMEAVTSIDIHTEHDVKDIGLCKEISDILTRHYPNHYWMVGCNHETRMIYVELPYGKELKAFPWGFVLHIHKLGSAKQMRKKVIWAGGELLERWGLARSKASTDVLGLASENGLDTSSAVG